MTAPLAEHWVAACDVIDDDPDGADLDRSRAAWGRAVLAAASLAHGEIDCDPAVFAPTRIGGPRDLLVCGWAVHVVAPTTPGLLAACRATWERWWSVDAAGHEHQDAEVDPFGEPVRAGDGYVLGYDVREVEDLEPLRAARCLQILIDELVAGGCTPARLTPAS